MPEIIEKCPHTAFTSLSTVNRITSENSNLVKKFMVDLKISCFDCGVQFKFIGVSLGFNYHSPTISFDGTELRTPIEPIY